MFHDHGSGFRTKNSKESFTIYSLLLPQASAGSSVLGTLGRHPQWASSTLQKVGHYETMDSHVLPQTISEMGVLLRWWCVICLYWVLRLTATYCTCLLTSSFSVFQETFFQGGGMHRIAASTSHFDEEAEMDHYPDIQRGQLAKKIT